MLLLFGVFKVCQKAYRFEPLSRFEFCTLPICATIIFLISMDWTIASLLKDLLFSVIAYGITLFQLVSLEVRDDRETILVKKGSTFLIGWGMSLFLGFVLEYLVSGELSSYHILESLGKDVFKKLTVFGVFTAVMAYSYASHLQRRYPRLQSVLKKRQ
ncbi:hypothetical protein [Streptococcus saliviloxodontae]|uniref:Uncharacterized protein n=1 Tax=Streptococcus saliviloxodontae TaxID=1349416 RepID=A0ABS2PMX3_9STRE|nr:hypothetical protein [Streptococcus saliviloxodontae]MBM7636788.1 hypothetical protein [Streptococcus saliviloxodontae]